MSTNRDALVERAEALPEYPHQLSIERITRAIESLHHAEDATDPRQKAIHLRRADESIMYARRTAEAVAAQWRQYNARARALAAALAGPEATDIEQEV